MSVIRCPHESLLVHQLLHEINTLIYCQAAVVARGPTDQILAELQEMFVVHVAAMSHEGAAARTLCSAADYCSDSCMQEGLHDVSAVMTTQHRRCLWYHSLHDDNV
jgi:hypothetical protein